MAQRKKSTKAGKSQDTASPKQAKCLEIADRGIGTGKEFAALMSAMIGDIAADRIDVRKANAICNASGKLLKVVEMQHRYAGANVPQKTKEFRLS